jgi:DNA invertase Pin-like site-specific DNA recombinase
MATQAQHHHQPSTAEPRTFIAYLRVSTDEQGRSGLGLEAQEAAIRAFVGPSDRLLASVVEVESGRRSDRPKLRDAIERCRRTGAVLLVAKLDRLSRNLPFLRSLIDSDIGVAFGDMPHVPAGAMGRFILTQMAAVAELEAGLISERTKAALAAAKMRGRKLGGDRGYRPPAPPDASRAGRASATARGQAADRTAFRLLAEVEKARMEGAASLHQIADALTARGTPAPSGATTWTATTVRRVLQRADRLARA